MQTLFPSQRPGSPRSLCPSWLLGRPGCKGEGPRRRDPGFQLLSRPRRPGLGLEQCLRGWGRPGTPPSPRADPLTPLPPPAQWGAAPFSALPPRSSFPDILLPPPVPDGGPGPATGSGHGNPRADRTRYSESLRPKHGSGAARSGAESSWGRGRGRHSRTPSWSAEPGAPPGLPTPAPSLPPRSVAAASAARSFSARRRRGAPATYPRVPAKSPRGSRPHRGPPGPGRAHPAAGRPRWGRARGQGGPGAHPGGREVEVRSLVTDGASPGQASMLGVEERPGLGLGLQDP